MAGGGRQGSAKRADAHGNTEWTTGDIWIRRHFNPGELTPETDRPPSWCGDFHDEDIQVYINGVQAYARRGYITTYEYKNTSAAAKKAIKPNAEQRAGGALPPDGRVASLLTWGLSVRNDPPTAPVSGSFGRGGSGQALPRFVAGLLQARLTSRAKVPGGCNARTPAPR